MRVWLSILVVASLLLASLATELGADKKSGFAFQAPAELRIELGTSAQLRLGIVPAKGFRVDKNAPLRIELGQAEASAVSAKKTLLRRRDAVEPQSSAPRFEVPLLAKRVGSERLTIRYRFWLCRSKICHPIRGEANVALSIGQADAGPPDAAPANESPR